MINKFRFLLILSILLLNSCQTESTQTPESQTETSNAFELFLVSDPHLSSADIQNHKLDNLPLAEEPLITIEDMTSYHWDIHTFELTDEAYKEILSLFSETLSVSGVPFVVVSNGVKIYAGAFWSMLSSISYDGVVILQPIDPAERTLSINLGYPGPDFFTGEDPRDNPQLRQALKDTGLIEE